MLVKGSKNDYDTYIFQRFNKLRMFIRDVFLHKRCSFEQLLARLATKPAFVLLLYTLLGGLRQFP
jgi:hypothetical protein